MVVLEEEKVIKKNIVIVVNNNVGDFQINMKETKVEKIENMENWLVIEEVG